MEEKKHKWISLHLFYANCKNQDLSGLVKRYVQWVIKSGIVTNFFFVQSKINGPHIRLRFRTRTDSYPILVANLKDYFSNFLEDHPSVREEPNFEKSLNPKNVWHENNTLQFAKFKAEFERYGGRFGYSLCLRQFQISSLSVLNYFENISCDEIEDRSSLLTQAFHFNFTYALAIGLNLEEMSLFFKQIYHQWLPKAYCPDDLNLKPFYLGQFQLEKYRLKKTVIAILDQVENGDILEDDFLGDWYIENKKLGKTFNQHRNFISERSPSYKVAFTSDVKEKDQNIWAIWMDLIHMNNNRMTILNQEESYLAFIIYMTIDEIIGKPESLGSQRATT